MVIRILIGTVLGFLTGLGVGGGTLLMLWLTWVLGTDPTEARLINLMFFIPSALISGFFHRKEQRRSVLLPAILAGGFSAGLLSVLGSAWDPVLLRKLFGILLITAGIRELSYRPRKAR